MDPLTIGSTVLGGLGALFGGSQQPELPPELRWIFKFLKQSALDAQAFGKGVPGSAPQELMAHATARAETSRNYDQATQGLQVVDPNIMGQADRAGSLASRKAAMLSGVDNSHLLNSLMARYQMRYQTAPGIAASATGAASGPRMTPNDGGMPQLLGQLAQNFAYSQARKPAPINVTYGGPAQGGFGGGSYNNQAGSSWDTDPAGGYDPSGYLPMGPRNA